MNSDDIQRLLAAQQQQLEAQNNMIAEMRAQTAARDKMYEDLLKQFGSVGVSPSTSATLPKKKKTRASTGSIPHRPPDSTPSTSKKTPASKPKKTASKAKTSASQPSATPKKKPSTKALNSTPKTSQTSKLPTPKTTPKRSPYQFLPAEQPEGFKDTKECFFLFIRVMWGLILAGAVPKAPDPALMEEFNARFSNLSDITGVLDSHSAQSLITDKEVITPDWLEDE